MENESELVVIADNIVAGKGDLLGENGLAVSIDIDGRKYLFDTGHGRTLLHNAAMLHVPLYNLDGVIVSHGHWDHTGGLPEVLKWYDSLAVYAHPLLFNTRYRVNSNGEKVYGGIPYTDGFLAARGASFLFTDNVRKIDKGFYLTGEIPRKHAFEVADLENRFIEIDGKVVEDIILDEQAAVITTELGLIIISGCSHAGLINSIDYAVSITGCQTVYCVIGGTHLGFAEQKQISSTIERLHDYDIQRLIVGHCTGVQVAAQLKNAFPDSFEFCHVGKRVRFRVDDPM
ncbi:MAG: MBL fold metallo-hydrolase [Spirochaetota bacterium]